MKELFQDRTRFHHGISVKIFDQRKILSKVGRKQYQCRSNLDQIFMSKDKTSLTYNTSSNHRHTINDQSWRQNLLVKYLNTILEQSSDQSHRHRHQHTSVRFNVDHQNLLNLHCQVILKSTLPSYQLHQSTNLNKWSNQNLALLWTIQKSVNVKLRSSKIRWFKFLRTSTDQTVLGRKRRQVQWWRWLIYVAVKITSCTT